MLFYLVTRRPRHTRWVATRTSSATRAPHISWPPRELAQAVLVDAALSISAVLHATRRPCRGTDDRARQRDGARQRGGAPCSCTPLARASQSWKWRHVHARARPRARSRCSTVVASPAGRGAAAEGWTGERQCVSRTDRAGGGGCGGGAPRPHGTNNFQQNPSPPTLLAADLLAAQRGPVPGEGCGRDSSRGQLSTKFDAAQTGCKAAAATDSAR